MVKTILGFLGNDYPQHTLILRIDIQFVGNPIVSRVSGDRCFNKITVANKSDLP